MTSRSDEYPAPISSSKVVSSYVEQNQEECNFDDDDLAELEDLEQFLKNAH